MAIKDDRLLIFKIVFIIDYDLFKSQILLQQKYFLQIFLRKTHFAKYFKQRYFLQKKFQSSGIFEKNPNIIKLYILLVLEDIII